MLIVFKGLPFDLYLQKNPFSAKKNIHKNHKTPQNIHPWISPLENLFETSYEIG